MLTIGQEHFLLIKIDISSRIGVVMFTVNGQYLLVMDLECGGCGNNGSTLAHLVSCHVEGPQWGHSLGMCLCGMQRHSNKSFTLG